MRRLSAALAVCLLLVSCVESPGGPSEPYPFVGTWNCEVATFTFTNTTYNNGDTTYPIQSVSRDGSNFTLRFGNGDVIGLGAVTATGLTWVSGTTGDQFNCVRAN